MSNEYSEKMFFGHPRGLATLFFTEMWERFSYYGMRALLVLFMVANPHAGNPGFGFDDAKANAIYGLYTCFVYLLALGGGWLADRFIGQRKAVWYGGIIIAAGHFSMAVPTVHFFYLGLILIVIGTGLLKPNVSTIVGDLYPEGGARRDAGFSVFYTGINIGALLGPFICGTIGEQYNFHWGFSLAGVGMVFGLIQYKMTEKYLGDAGIEPKMKPSEGEQKANPMMKIVLLAALVGLFVFLQVMGMVDLTSIKGFAEATTKIIVTIAVFFFGYQLIAGGFNLDEKKRIVLIAFLFVASAIFWSGFEQAGSSLNLFAKYATDRDLLGWEVPASVLQMVNPFFIIVLAPFFGMLWVKLAAKNLDPSIPAKFAFGLIFLGLGFLVMVGAAKVAADQVEAATGASMMWLIMTYLLHTTGELCLSPVGLSTITKLAPKRITGQMMGIWFLSTSLGNLIAGLVAGRFNFSVFEKAGTALEKISEADVLDDKLLAEIDKGVIESVDPSIIDSGNLEAFKNAVANMLQNAREESLTQMPDLFWQIVVTTCLAGVVLLVISPLLKKLAKHQH